MSDASAIRSALVSDAVDFVAARARQRPKSVPAALKKVMRFKKLPAPARAQLERVLERDDAFRAAMAKGATERAVGEAGLLWLTRPDGWEERFQALVAQAEQREATLASFRVEDDFENAEAKAQVALVELQSAHAALEEDLTAAQRERDEAQAELRERGRKMAALEEALVEAREERAEAIRQLKHHEQVLARSVEDRRKLQAALEAPRRRWLSLSPSRHRPSPSL